MQKALSVAEDGDRILVSVGEYRPDEINSSNTDSQDATFTLASGVEIYGGFDSGNTSYDDFGEQDPVFNETILTGDVDEDVSESVGTAFGNAANAYHVVTIPLEVTDCILDGFTITGGYLDSSVPSGLHHSYGAGMLIGEEGDGTETVDTAPEVRDCVFKYNKAVGGKNGGGVGIFAGPEVSQGSILPTFWNCTFRDNDVDNAGDGAGAASNNGAPTFYLCNFLNNDANGDGGAVAFLEHGQPVMYNCNMFSNEATDGGAIFAICSTQCFGVGNCFQCTFYPSVTLVNCLVNSNDASSGGGIYNDNAEFTIVNTTIVRNQVTGNGGGYYHSDTGNSADSLITNSILWDNEDGGGGGDSGPQIYLTGGTSAVDLDVTFSAVEGGEADIGISLPGVELGAYTDNIEPANIRFVDADGADNIFGTNDDDFRLKCNSPAVDVGSNTEINAYPDSENLDGDSDTTEATPDLQLSDDRIFDGDDDSTATVDMGAYEYFCDTCLGDIDGDDNVGFADLLELLSNWTTSCTGNACDSDLDDDNDVDFQDLLILLANWGPCVGCVCEEEEECADKELGTNCEGLDELLDLMENGTTEEKENAQCWLEHYVEHHNPTCGQAPSCPDDDPLEGSHL